MRLLDHIDALLADDDALDLLELALVVVVLAVVELLLGVL